MKSVLNGGRIVTENTVPRRHPPEVNITAPKPQDRVAADTLPIGVQPPVLSAGDTLFAGLQVPRSTLMEEVWSNGGANPPVPTADLASSEELAPHAFASLIEEVYTRFVSGKGKPFIEGCVIDAANHQGGAVRFIGIEKHAQKTLDFTRLRIGLERTLSSSQALMPLVQVVGDSGTRFSDAGLEVSGALLRRHLSDDCLIEYGGTASPGDANWVVGEHLEAHPTRASHVIGNLAGACVTAISEWGCSISPRIRNAVLVYDQIGELTSFEATIPSSDYIMRAGDKMLCLEGGPQAFEQCINALNRGCLVIAQTGLRDAGGVQRVSAAGLLRALRSAVLNDVSAASVRRGYQAYMEEKTSTPAQRKRFDQALEHLVRSETPDILARLATNVHA